MWTRLQMVRFLLRTLEALDLPMPDEVSHPLSDEVSHPFDDLGSVGTSGRLAVARLHKLGIIAGRTSSRFAPDEDVNRAQMALMLHRLLEFAGVGMPALVSDGSSVPAGSSFVDLEGRSASTVTAVGQLVALGVMEGIHTRQLRLPRVGYTRTRSPVPGSCLGGGGGHACSYGGGDIAGLCSGGRGFGRQRSQSASPTVGRIGGCW